MERLQRRSLSHGEPSEVTAPFLRASMMVWTLAVIIEFEDHILICVYSERIAINFKEVEISDEDYETLTALGREKPTRYSRDLVTVALQDLIVFSRLDITSHSVLHLLSISASSERT
jgi:DNA helicase TIP49 (TBP-interacting protein)